MPVSARGTILQKVVAQIEPVYLADAVFTTHFLAGVMVRRATERNTGREVAVKRISCVNLSEQRRQMLVSEVGIFLQVHHQNIVKLLEVYESEVGWEDAGTVAN
ncbi:unnamed protein product [Symbiodinium natans]|uniref:Protein kinase domain-containing protein n=1 Tax=Symbiodinium natans TaxID=878477 RepID=A0A812R0P2_9DINO|nr:unnamed protein product [Symbiodinium natans]